VKNVQQNVKTFAADIESVIGVAFSFAFYRMSVNMDIFFRTFGCYLKPQDWQMVFNVDKCMVMHFSFNNQSNQW